MVKFSEKKSMLENFRANVLKKELLDQLVRTSVNAQKESNYQDTLNVTLAQKYDKGNPVMDDMYEWTWNLNN